MQLVDNPAVLVYHHHHHHPPPMAPTYLSNYSSNTVSTHSRIPARMCSLSHEYSMHSPYSESLFTQYLVLAWGKHTTKAPKLQLKSHASFDIPAQMFFHESFSSSFSTECDLSHLCAANGHTLFISVS